DSSRTPAAAQGIEEKESKVLNTIEMDDYYDVDGDDGDDEDGGCISVMQSDYSDHPFIVVRVRIT
ncbi:hypothetical protein Tco_0839941, partial [Tanacetum coccineum]